MLYFNNNCIKQLKNLINLLIGTLIIINYIKIDYNSIDKIKELVYG